MKKKTSNIFILTDSLIDHYCLDHRELKRHDYPHGMSHPNV